MVERKYVQWPGFETVAYLAPPLEKTTSLLTDSHHLDTVGYLCIRISRRHEICIWIARLFCRRASCHCRRTVKELAQFIRGKMEIITYLREMTSVM
jgi:hypothetical protein